MNMFAELLNNEYIRMGETIAHNQPRGRGRGILRRRLGLTTRRLQELLNGRNIEVTLQRVILDLMEDDNVAKWGNEFAVAAGVYRGPRAAVDIVRTTPDTDWDFFELKAWEAPDTPFDAAIQVIMYMFAFSHLCHRRVQPYPGPPRSVRLWLLAPEKFFEKYGGAKAVSEGLQTLEEAVRLLQRRCPNLGKVSFASQPLVLDRKISQNDFISCFDLPKVHSFVANNTLAPRPRSVLDLTKVHELKEWVKRAIAACEKR